VGELASGRACVEKGRERGGRGYGDTNVDVSMHRH
jgi:hypothetical protein